MGFGGVGKARIARLLGRPIQQGQIHIAVDDHSPGLLGIGQIAPRLNDPGLFVVTLKQRFCRQQRKAARLAVASQTPVRHARERIEEAQIVGIRVVTPGDAQAKRAGMLPGHRAEFFVTAHLPRQPQLPGPEAGCPFDVFG
ncbi:hypothetical protein D3C86_1533800 [compost metagenome]